MGHLTRRQFLTDATVAALSLIGALTVWIVGGTPSPGMTGVWLTLLCVLLGRVTFQVGKGLCSPVMLAIAPMLLLVPAPVVPLLLCFAQIATRFQHGWTSGWRDVRLVLPLADAIFALGPAVLLMLAPAPDTLTAEALLLGGAFVLLILNDLAFWPLMLLVGSGADPRPELRAAAWIYAFDAMLVPIGFTIALAAREVPASPAAILPLAAVLAFLARERRTRAAHEATLMTVLQHASDLILIVERNGRIRTVMGSSATLLGDAEDPGWLLDRVHPEDLSTVTAFLTTAPGEAEWRLRHDDGSYRHVSAVAADLTGDPHVGGLVLTLHDDEVRQALRHRASHDSLTGLANRALFEERVEAALGLPHAAVVYIDLDEFKPINDRLGHAAGDEVLRLVARRLESCVRGSDTVARLGGDEFALLITAGQPEEVADRVRAALATPMQVGEERLRVGASVGFATGGEDVDALLAAADQAMYEVKRGAPGRSR